MEVSETVTRVLLLATLDTKGPEAFYLSSVLAELGARPLLMDLSMRVGDQRQQPGISADQVARAGGSSLEALSASGDMTGNMAIMVKGASCLISGMMEEGKVHGVIGIGGYTGTSMITSIMHTLPFGVPKLMVSSAAAIRGLSSKFLNTSDLMLFHSVVEIAGLCGPVRNVLERAGHALCSMARADVTRPVIHAERAIAMTMMSPCERCARSVRLALEQEGYQVMGFHANGIGDRAMEEMAGAGLFRAVIDLAPGAVGEHLYGFMRDAGPDRLEQAGKSGVPQIISTCGVNHVTPPKSRPLYAERRRYDLDEHRTWVRATPDELREVAHAFARKLNRSEGPVRVLIPLKGWSSVDRPGSPTYDPEEDRTFGRTLREAAKHGIEIVEVDANMEDPEFARAVLGAAINLLRR